MKKTKTQLKEEAMNNLLDAVQNVLDNASGPDCTEHSLIKTSFLVKLGKAAFALREVK